VNDVELVLISPDHPDAMLRHTRACRDCGVPFVADPSQQIAHMDGADLSLLVRGARYLFTNEYERGLLIRKTGTPANEILQSVGAWVTTLGPGGTTITVADNPPIHVPAAAVRWKDDPTGVGDAFRAGFLAGTSSGLGNERSAQMGCVMAALVLETSGSQEYTFHPAEFISRVAESYGPAAAAEVAPDIDLLATFCSASR
jgi:adenosine kinase